MVQIIEYVSKEQFEEIKARFGESSNINFVHYWYNHEFPETEQLDIVIIKDKLAVSVRHEIEGQ